MEPSLEIPDASHVQNPTRFPLLITFWRTSVQKGILHRCPLFAEGLGLSHSSFCLDVLHTLHLGIMNRYVHGVFMRLFAGDAWRLPATTTTGDARLAMNTARLRADIFEWYVKRAKLYPHEGLTRMQDLTIGMASPILKTKGAEAKGLLYFCVDAVEVHQARLQDAALLTAAGSELVKFLAKIDEFPTTLSISQQQDRGIKRRNAARLHGPHAAPTVTTPHRQRQHNTGRGEPTQHT